MKYRRIPFFLQAAALLLAAASAAHAQELTVFAGGLFPGKLSIHNVPTQLDNGPIFGVRLETPFAALLKMEYSFAGSQDFLFPRNTPGVTNTSGFLLNANLLLGVPVGKVVPYGTVGLGFMHEHAPSGLGIGTKFAINYGGGLKFPKLAGPFGLRVDARGYTATGVFSHSVNMFELSAGLTIGF